jgi:hypothetical protein
MLIGSPPLWNRFAVHSGMMNGTHTQGGAATFETFGTPVWLSLGKGEKNLFQEITVMGIRNPVKETLERLDSKTLDAQFCTEIVHGLNCSPFEAQAVLEVVKEIYFSPTDKAAPKPRQTRTLGKLG